MDSLTHGLLGAAVGALPFERWRRFRDEHPRAGRAGVLAGVLAAELPDLDYLVPAADSVLHTLQAHRGPTHSLLGVPLVALVAAIVARLFFREVRFAPLFLRALIAVPLVHLLPDVWTGWGTRLFLPFSDARVALDWTMVIDPVFTLPLVAAAVWAYRRREQWRRALAIGVAVSVAYLGVRIASLQVLTATVRGEYPAARSVHVFPAALSVLTWRYVAVAETEYRVGAVQLGGEPQQQATHPLPRAQDVSPVIGEIATVREALAWARFPVVRSTPVEGGQRVEIADLRYHLRGAPTLTFVITAQDDGTVTEARLDRGGTAGELLRRWRENP